MAEDRRPLARLAVLATALTLAGCWSTGYLTPGVNAKPAFLGTVTKTTYDGAADDLLTAGLGKTGLGAAAAQPPLNPAAPTAAELRRLAIFNNYRAILDISPKGGYGVLYGPNVDSNGNNTLGEGKIAGVEYLAYAELVSDDLPDDYKTCIYRVVQEALHNCSRHSHASAVRIRVQQAGERINLSIQDDGQGFDAAQMKGLGLLGIQERVNHFGGLCQIHSTPGRGTVLAIELPLPLSDAVAFTRPAPLASDDFFGTS